MFMGLSYRYWVYDAEGRLTKYQRRRQAHSWVVAFFEAMRALWETVNATGVLDIASVSQTLLHDAQVTANVWGQMDGPVSNTDRGIVFGETATAVTMTDNSMALLLAEGTGASQLEYQAQVTSVAAIGATESTVTLTRQGNNNSGSPITIREVGIHMRSAIPGPLTAVFLAARDVLPIEEVVANGGNFVFEYTVRLAA